MKALADASTKCHSSGTLQGTAWLLVVPALSAPKGLPSMMMLLRARRQQLCHDDFLQSGVAPALCSPLDCLGSGPLGPLATVLVPLSSHRAATCLLALQPGKSVWRLTAEQSTVAAVAPALAPSARPLCLSLSAVVAASLVWQAETMSNRRSLQKMRGRSQRQARGSQQG